MSGSSSVLNPNIALQAGQGTTQPVNMLTQAGDITSLQRNMLALQQGKQGLQSTLAIGQAAQQSINPDGTVDQGKFRTLVSQDPDAAYGAQAAIGTSQDQQEQGLKVQGSQLDLQTAKAGVFSSALGPLLAQGNAVTSSDVFGVLARLHAQGVPVDEAAAQVASTMPSQGGAGLHSWLQDTVGQSMAPSDFLPKPNYINTGGTVQAIDANPLTNSSATSASVPMTLSPGEQVNPFAGPLTPGGGKTVIPAASFAASHGLGSLIPSTGRASLPPSLVGPNGGPSPAAGSGFAAGPAPSAPQPNAAPPASSGGQSPFGGGGAWGSGPATGAGAPAGASAGAATSTPAAGSSSPYGTPMQTTLGPGQEAGLAAAGAQSAQQWAGLQSQVGGSAAGGGSAGRIYQLQKSLGLLQQLGPQGTGPSAASSQQLVSYVRSLPVIGGLASVIGNPQNVTNYDEANKYLTAYAAARAGAHGGTTDSQLATTLSSNASTHISNLAAQDVVKANIGLERMDQAQAQAFQKSGQTPDQFANFSANWNASMDPRAFVAPELSPQQFSTMVGGMSPADRTKFQSTYNTGISNGWIGPPAWAQGGSGTPPAGASASPQAPPVAPSGAASGGY